MKKRRGQKRYYKKLITLTNSDKKRASAFLGDTQNWFDFGHTHFDWDGVGNNSWRKRLPHLECLFKYFLLFEAKLKEFEKDYQLFGIIYKYDSAEDALYVHTQNPNQINFPFKPELSKVVNLRNSNLAAYLNSKQEFEKLFGESESENYCIIYKKGTGIDLI